jgi:cytochrome b6-f complex iron-sulfur subunit
VHPHSCTVDYDPARNDWLCPCHDSRFTLEGVVTRGPAKKNLKVPASRVEGEALVVDLSSVRA